MTILELKTYLINYGWSIKTVSNIDTFTKNNKVIHLHYINNGNIFKFAMIGKGGDLIFLWPTHDFKLDIDNNLLVIDDELAIRL